MTSKLIFILLTVPGILWADNVLTKGQVDKLKRRCFVWKLENCTAGHLRANRRMVDAVTKKKSKAEACDLIVKSAWKTLNKKDSLTALYRFNQALLIDDQRSEAYWGAAMAYYQVELPIDAEPLVDRAVTLNNKLGEAFLLQAKIKLLLGKKAPAESAYHSALTLGVEPDSTIEEKLTKK